MEKKYKRLLLLSLSFIIIACVITVICVNLKENISFFYSPTELSSVSTISEKMIRVGGVVKKGSVVRGKENITFIITDYKNSIPIIYTKKILPNLFKENNGIVAEGYFQKGKFFAHSLLAKHNENYKPPLQYQ